MHDQFLIPFRGNPKRSNIDGNKSSPVVTYKLGCSKCEDRHTCLYGDDRFDNMVKCKEIKFGTDSAI